jgi:hypothetical protein
MDSGFRRNDESGNCGGIRTIDNAGAEPVEARTISIPPHRTAPAVMPLIMVSEKQA